MGEAGRQLRCPITEDLSRLRELVTAFAADAGLGGDRLDDLVLAVNEAADNVLEHGGGTGTLVAGTDAAGIWVDVIDMAGTLTGEHVRRGAHATPTVAYRGFGLWLMHRLCDEVTLDHLDDRSRLRLRMRHPAAGGNGAPER
ncbi:MULTISPECIES: ATP-binding protein [unclassified Nonomuraea]|uniref:ATP-binding protein n=1 Tax=unclassified Nonomuraea TaxID=2593643 RepID=UPI0033EA5823